MLWDDEEAKKAAASLSGEVSKKPDKKSDAIEASDIPTAERLPQEMPSFLKASETSSQEPLSSFVPPPQIPHVSEHIAETNHKEDEPLTEPSSSALQISDIAQQKPESSQPIGPMPRVAEPNKEQDQPLSSVAESPEVIPADPGEDVPAVVAPSDASLKPEQKDTAISLSDQARLGTTQAPMNPSSDKSILADKETLLDAIKAEKTKEESESSSNEKISFGHPADDIIVSDVQAAAAAEQTKTDYTSNTFLKELFADGNECVTAINGSFPIKEDTRSLLALFSNGRFFVSESAKFDGKVLGFQYQAKKRRLQIGKPEYVPTIILNDIYEYALQVKAASTKVDISDAQEQARMQRDFVTIVTRAAANHVSDIHIVVADHSTVMFRINGLMQTEMEYTKEWGESFVRAAFASSDISDSNYAQNEYQAAQKLGRTPLRGSNGRLLLPRNVLGIRLQFNPIAFGTRYVVMRLLYAEDDATSASDLEVLGFTKRETGLFYQLRSEPTGIVIVSGPTGSGKSTTLQRNMIAMLQEHNYEINLITVEDPPEYPIPGARQMPVTNATLEEEKDREFNKALAAALRSDPDSLMIGEIRTLSAADLAFRGALSGHNVWTTLHANSAAAVIMRLKDMGVEDFKLQDPSIMRGMLAQRLFRKLCPHCRIKAATNPTHPAVQRLERALGDVALDLAYLRGPGCKECDFRGVSGRTVVSEFILPDATFLDLMIKGEVNKAMSYWLNDLNGQTLREAAISRMLNGIIDIEEVEHWTGFLDQQLLI